MVHPFKVPINSFIICLLHFINTQELLISKSKTPKMIILKGRTTECANRISHLFGVLISSLVFSTRERNQVLVVQVSELLSEIIHDVHSSKERYP